MGVWEDWSAGDWIAIVSRFLIFISCILSLSEFTIIACFSSFGTLVSMLIPVVLLVFSSFFSDAPPASDCISQTGPSRSTR